MADIASKKKKPYFTISTGLVGSKASGGDAVEIKVGTGWSSGKTKFKKRSGKGHHLNANATRRVQSK